MESTTANTIINTPQYSTNIRAYFYTDHNEQTDNMVIVSSDNKRIRVGERKSFQVLIDFMPEDYVEYEFGVIEATSTYLRLTQLTNEYLITIITESTELNHIENVINYEPEYEPDEEIPDESQEQNIIWETAQPKYESDNEIYEYNQLDGYASTDSEEGYDSEGFYFRVK